MHLRNKSCQRLWGSLYSTWEGSLTLQDISIYLIRVYFKNTSFFQVYSSDSSLYAQKLSMERNSWPEMGQNRIRKKQKNVRTAKQKVKRSQTKLKKIQRRGWKIIASGYQWSKLYPYPETPLFRCFSCFFFLEIW